MFHFEAREKQLLPLYTSVATTFADLHDRAGRMKAKGVIKESISWKDEGLIGHEIGTKDWGILGLGLGHEICRLELGWGKISCAMRSCWGKTVKLKVNQ